MKHWRLLTPPILAKSIDQLATRTPVFRTYEEALAKCGQNFEHAEIAKLVAWKTKNVLNDGITCRPSTRNYLTSYPQLQQLASLLTDTQDNHVIDFGGACGLHYFVLRPTLPSNASLTWSIIETPLMARFGEALATENLRFHTSIEDAITKKPPSVVYSSGTLPYVSDPLKTLNQLAQLQAPHLLLSRTALTVRSQPFIMLHRTRLRNHGPENNPPDLIDRSISYPLTVIPMANLIETLETFYKHVTITLESPNQHYTKFGSLHHYRAYAAFPKHRS